MTEEDVYAQIGEDGFARLVRAFYAQVPADEVLGPMYPKDDLEGAEARLRDFLVGRFGGPARYIEQRGHPRLRMRHAPFVIGEAERDAWLRHMTAALDSLVEERDLHPSVEAAMVDYFAMTADHMMNVG